jgi:hypothetical protein
MAEEPQNVVDSPEEPDAQQTPPEGAATEPPEGEGQEPEADGRVREARKEAARYRERAKKAEADLEKARQAGMSDQERQQAEFEQAKTRVADLEQTNTDLRLQLAALKAGLDQSLVEFIDLDRVVAKYGVDDPADQAEIEKALKKFAAEKHVAASANSADAGASSTARPNGVTPSLNSFIRREAGIHQ